jgi:hypothetical protein
MVPGHRGGEQSKKEHYIESINMILQKDMKYLQESQLMKDRINNEKKQKILPVIFDLQEKLTLAITGDTDFYHG